MRSVWSEVRFKYRGTVSVPPHFALVIVINLAIKHGIENILRGFGVVQWGRVGFAD